MAVSLQKTAWGSFEWMEDAVFSDGTAANIAIVHVNPGAEIPEHVHYAEKQFIYVLSGQAEHIVNGVSGQYGAGSHIFMPVGTVHMFYNRGDSELTELLFSVPVKFQMEASAAERGKEFLINDVTDLSFLNEAFLKGVERLKKDTLSHLRMPVVITDSQHNHIFRTHLARECTDCTNESCPLWNSMQTYHQEHASMLGTTVCPKGLTVLVQPVSFEDKLVGFIKGGLFSEQPALFEGESSQLDVPTSAFYPARAFLQDICTYLIGYYHDCRLERELLISRKEREEEELYTKAITDAYRQTRNTALNLQLRNHFLFNALNSIASLSIEEGATSTYKSVIDLAELFRGLLRQEGTRVSFREELEFLRKYLRLQELRYKDGLKVEWNIDHATEAAVVPHNFLQPIVENSFAHAFGNMTKVKKIKISAIQQEHTIHIEISDNGCGIPENTLEKMKKSFFLEDAHGISMVLRKLSGVYGSDFRFDIESKEHKGTIYKIDLPA